MTFCSCYCIKYQRGARVVNEEIEKAYVEASGDGHKNDACSLQHKAQQIELHGHKVPAFPLGPGGFRQTRHIVILVFYEPEWKDARQSAMCHIYL